MNNNKLIIYIFRAITPKEVEDILVFATSQHVQVFYQNLNFVSPLQEKVDDSNSLEFKPTSHLVNNQNIIDLIVQFAHIKINSKTLANRFQFNRSNSYWYYLRFSLYNRSKSVIQEAYIINKTQFSNSKSIVYSVYKNVAKGVDSDVDLRWVQNSQEKSTGKFRFLFGYGFIFLWRALSGFILFPFRRKNTASNLILINPYNYQEIYDIEKQEVRKGDPHLFSLLKKTLKVDKYQYLSQLRPPSLGVNLRMDWRSYFKNDEFSEKTIYFEPFLFLSLLNPWLFRKYKIIKNKWKQTMLDATNQKVFSKENAILFEYIKPLYKQLFLALWREEASLLLNKFLKLKSVVAIDEHSIQNQTIFNGLKSKGVKTIAIQHGAISNGNIAYHFCQEDQPYSPYPDLSLLRGIYTKAMLIKQAYPENKLEVVGHLRTDSIPSMLESDFNLELFPKSKNKATIVYATQPMPKVDEPLKKQQAQDFFKLCNDFPQFNFVIKPHPNEGSLDLYYKLAKELKQENFKLFFGNLYQLLAKADAVITYFSTVGLEAIYFKKPLLTLDYNELDLQGYLAEGVAMNSRNYRELKSNLIKAIESPATSTEQLNDFISQRVFKIDGKVAERCLSIL